MFISFCTENQTERKRENERERKEARGRRRESARGSKKKCTSNDDDKFLNPNAEQKQI